MDKILSDQNEDHLFAKHFGQFYEQLDLESERGSVIVGAAFIADALEEMLNARMIAPLQSNDELFNGPYAPLSSLSAKIDLAYRTGLISPKVRTSLHLIRKLRNDFAHLSLQINFESSSVQSRIRELFNLNKELFETFWQIIKNDVDDVKMNSDLKYGLGNVVKHLGWKSTYNALISVIAATFLAGKYKIPKIVSSHRD